MPPPDPFALIDAAGTEPAPVTPKPVVDPFEYIDSGGAPTDRLAATTHLGLIQDPQRAARVLKLRDRIAMPADFIDRNLDDVEKEAERAGFDPNTFRRESPLVAKWLSQAPEYAAVSRDDLGRLSAVERFVAESPDYKFLPNGQVVGVPNKTGLAQVYTPLELLRKLQKDEQYGIAERADLSLEAERDKDRGAFASGFVGALGSTQRLVMSVTGQDSDAAKATLDRIARSSATNDPGFWNDVVRAGGGLAADAPLMLAGSALAPLARLKALTGSKALAGAAATAVAVQPLAIREGVLTGIDNGWANGLAAWGIETVIPAAFGTTGVEHVIEQLAARGIAREAAHGLVGAAGGLLKHAGLEATEEVVTELAHALHEAASGINPDALTAEQLWPRLGVAGIVGGGAGAGFNLPNLVAQMARKGRPGDTMQRIDAALAGQALVQRLTAEATESETAKRYEGGAKTLFQSLTQGKAEHVYIDHDSWSTVAAKAGLDPRAAAIELLGGPPIVAGQFADAKRAKSLAQAAKTYDDAVRTGTPLTLNTADLAFFLSKQETIADAMSKEVRLDPQALNVREAEELLKSMEAAPEPPGEDVKFTAEQESQAILDFVQAGLVAQGYDTGSAKRNATQIAAVFRTQAARFNEGKAADDPTRITPAQLWREWNVSIQRPIAAVLGSPTEQTPDQIVAASRAGVMANTADPTMAEGLPEESVTDAEGRTLDQPDERSVAADLSAILSGPDAERQYDALPDTDHGKILSVDIARELSPDYAASNQARGRLSVATHGPASAFINQLFFERLNTAPAGPVLMMAGGGASGKSTVLRGPAASLVKDSAIVLDGVMGDHAAAKTRIDAALAEGRPVTIAYVYRPFNEAVVSNAQRALADGRLVPIRTLARAHAGANDAIHNLRVAYQDSPQVAFRAFDNTGNAAVEMPIARLAALRYKQGDENLEQTIDRLIQESPYGQESDEGRSLRDAYAGRLDDNARTDGGNQETGSGESGAEEKRLDQRKGKRRASITFGGKPGERRTLINIFQSADLSSFLHESGHLYLEVMADLSQRQGAPTQIKEDFDRALAYIGAKDYASITTEQHEIWARSWEAYLMEGRAPTAELRGAFARFAAWLGSIYRSVKSLSVELNPEIRGVMDRLVATRDEINAASNALGDDGFSEHAIAMGLTPEQAERIAKADADALYKAQADLQSEAMSEIRREHETHWKELRKEVEAEVANEVNAQPVYIAESVLRRGVLPGGVELPTNIPAVKLDATEINQRLDQSFGTRDERVANRKRLSMMYAGTGGIPLDQAAELFGFSSGDGLLTALLGMRNRKDLIQAETDVRMRQRFGDILVDGTIAEKAMDALHGERRADVHMEKVKALAKRVGKKSAPLEVMRAAAEAKIAATMAGNIVPNLYLRAETKARQQVQEHLAKQEWEAALAAKQRELLNHELYRAAVNAKKEVQSALDYARSFDEQKVRERVGKAGGWEWTVTLPTGQTTEVATEEEARRAASLVPGATFDRTSGYLEQIDALRERYSLTVTKKDADKRMSLNAWIALQQTNGVQINMPPELLREARRIPWRKVSVAELIGLHDGLKQIKHLADTKNKLSRQQKIRELAALSKTMAETLKRTKPNPKAVPAEDGRQNRALVLVADLWAAHRKIAGLLREMDGFEDGGIFTGSILQPLNEAADNEASMGWEAKQKQDALWNAWHDAISRGDWQPNEKREFDGFDGGLTRMGAIMVALNWGNEGNRARLMEGNKVTEGQVQKVLDSLTAADWNLVEGVWEHIDSYWSEIKALEQRVTGTAPEKVEASPFPTKHGTIKGGYFPIAYNKESAALRIDGDALNWAKQMADQAYGHASTKHGHANARATGLGQPLSLDPNVIGRHLTQVIHDLTHREALSDAARILANQTVADSIAKHMGPRTLAQIKTWLGDIATGGRPSDATSKFMGWLRRGFSMASMGFRPMTAALQLTGFSNAAQRVGPGRMAYAIKKLFESPQGFASNFAFVESKSKMMANRGRTQTQDLTEVMSGIKRDRLSQTQETVTKYGYWMMQRTQGIVDTVTWLAAYSKAQEEGASEEEAISQANQIVLDTQSGGQLKDLSAVQRNAYSQVFTGAYTYGNMLFNQLHDVVGGARARARSGDTPGAWVQGLTGFFLTAALPAAMTLALRGMLRGTPEKRKDPVATQYAIELLSTIMGTMIGVRELSGAIQGFSYQGPATTKTLGAFADLIAQVGQGDLDKGLLHAATDSIGGTLGLPSGEIWSLGTGLDYYFDHPGLDVRPIIFGPPPKR